MAIEYLGLSEIKGPLVALEGVSNAAYDEIAWQLYQAGIIQREQISKYGNPLLLDRME